MRTIVKPCVETHDGAGRNPPLEQGPQPENSSQRTAARVAPVRRPQQIRSQRYDTACFKVVACFNRSPPLRTQEPYKAASAREEEDRPRGSGSGTRERRASGAPLYLPVFIHRSPCDVPFSGCGAEETNARQKINAPYVTPAHEHVAAS